MTYAYQQYALPSALSIRSERLENVVHDAVNLGIPKALVGRDPDVELVSAHEHLSTGQPEARQRMSGINQSVSEPTDAAARVGSQGTKRQVGVQRRRHLERLDCHEA